MINTNGPTIEYNRFRDNSDKWKNVIHVFSDSYVTNCELYGVKILVHSHKRNELCKCDNWSWIR
jgi:hypothetical protein